MTNKMRPLKEIVASLDEYPVEDPYEVGPTIFANVPWTAESLAEVLCEDPIDGRAPSSPELAYLLEVSIAKEVLEVWSSWRAGAKPTPEEATQAVIYYAIRDAYLPVE